MDQEKAAAAGNNVGESLAFFIEKYRRIIIGVFIAAAVIVAGLAAGMGIRDSLEKRALSRLELLIERYDALRFSIADPEQAEAVEELLGELAREARRSPGYAGARAWHLVASMQADRKIWNEAEAAWKEAARKAGKTYLAPVALFNAGAAAEEQGDAEGAAAYYDRASSYTDFPQAARALFSVGRLAEAREDGEAALAAYRKLIEGWPSTAWANLANSRIISLAGSE
ncbi:MAG: tetratricopeptide repeat protein [Spirochaetaceae bacterium]|nr:tetratricopeptide repeat protein [Spirochaetaceae bacterium]